MRTLIDHTWLNTENKYVVRQLWDVNRVPVTIQVTYTVSGYGSSAYAITEAVPRGFSERVRVEDMSGEWTKDPDLQDRNMIHLVLRDRAADLAARMEMIIGRKWKVRRFVRAGKKKS